MQSAPSPAPSGSFCSAADRQILRVFVPMWVKALGQGFRPLTRRSSSMADREKSISPMLFLIMPTWVASASF